MHPILLSLVYTGSAVFFSLNFLCLRGQPTLAFLHPNSKFLRMESCCTHLGSSNFSGSIVYCKEQSQAEPTWVQRGHPYCGEECPRRSKLLKKSKRDPVEPCHLRSYKQRRALRSFIPTTHHGRYLLYNIADQQERFSLPWRCPKDGEFPPSEAVNNVNFFFLGSSKNSSNNAHT